jgi:hypothetical protein
MKNETRTLRCDICGEEVNVGLDEGWYEAGWASDSLCQVCSDEYCDESEIKSHD